MFREVTHRKGHRISREDVISAALDCIREEGVSALGVNRVARELGIKPPSLYNHVDGNDDLKRSVTLEGWCRLLDRMTRAVNGRTDVADALWALARAYRAFVQQSPSLYAVMTDMGRAEAAEEPESVHEQLLGLFTNALAPLSLPPSEEVRAVDALRATLHGFACLEVTDKVGPARKHDQTYDWLVGNVIEALVR